MTVLHADSQGLTGSHLGVPEEVVSTEVVVAGRVFKGGITRNMLSHSLSVPLLGTVRGVPSSAHIAALTVLGGIVSTGELLLSRVSMRWPTLSSLSHLSRIFILIWLVVDSNLPFVNWLRDHTRLVCVKLGVIWVFAKCLVDGRLLPLWTNSWSCSLTSSSSRSFAVITEDDWRGFKLATPAAQTSLLSLALVPTTPFAAVLTWWPRWVPVLVAFLFMSTGMRLSSTLPIFILGSTVPRALRMVEICLTLLHTLLSRLVPFILDLVCLIQILLISTVLLSGLPWPIQWPSPAYVSFDILTENLV